MNRSWGEGAQPQAFGALLKMHRSTAGLSQEELADRARLSVKTISALEQGVRQKPFRHTIANLSDALGLSASARTELERAAARWVSAPASTLESPPNNLPWQLSSFIGRESDVAAIEDLLNNHRLVTLVGAGGVGKTRLALQVAAAAIHRWDDGEWFVDLGSLTNPLQLAETIAAVLGLHGSPNRTVVETLFSYLKHKHLLLILDNCEHLVDEVAIAADAFLRRSPGVRILATSREALKVDGERIYRAQPLRVPTHSELDSLDPQHAVRFDAIGLFVDRAVARDHRFALTEELLPVVAEICHRLDGIALAIELAAARVNVLSPMTLAESLRERFTVLTGGDRATVPRHRTMTALIDWSYDFLNPKEQLLFRRLAVFVDGFTLELAFAMCEQDEAIGREEVLELLASLVDKSLVRKEATNDAAERYRLLEPTRAYASEKLREHGERETAAQAHARAMLALASAFDSVLQLQPDKRWRQLTAAGAGNWRTAMEWSLEAGGDVPTGQELAASRGFGFGQAPSQSRRWVEVALEKCDEETPPAIRAKLELAIARYATALGQLGGAEAFAAAERAACYYAGANDRLGVAEAQAYVGLSLVFQSRMAEGKRELNAASDTAHELHAQWIIALTTHALAVAHALGGEPKSARRLFRTALDMLKGAECDRYAAQVVAGGLAHTEYVLGNAETAVQLSREAARTLRVNRNYISLTNVRTNCSGFLIALHRFDEARSEAREALVLARDTGLPLPLALALERLVAIATFQRQGHSKELESLSIAASVLGFADARLRAFEYKRGDLDQQEYDTITSGLQAALATNLGDLMEAGARWSEDRAIAEALKL